MEENHANMTLKQIRTHNLINTLIYDGANLQKIIDNQNKEISDLNNVIKLLINDSYRIHSELLKYKIN